MATAESKPLAGAWMDGALSYLEAIDLGDFIASMRCVTFWVPAAPKCHSPRQNDPVAAARWVRGPMATAENKPLAVVRTDGLSPISRR